MENTINISRKAKNERRKNMANIIAYIRKEVEKGNTLLDTKGNFINPEKLENTMRKSYLAGLKNGSVSFEKPFAEYQQDEIEKMFIPSAHLMSEITKVFCYEVPNSMPEPQETVAQ